MGATELDQRALTGLRDHIDGTVIRPGDPGYDEARAIYNGMIDRRPEVIVGCITADDVATAIRFARELDLEIAVRGGGHGVAGTASSHGGLVIDLRQMNRVVVDPETLTATVGGGATNGDVDRATQPHHLATTTGRVSTTGIGGFTLGGGSGWLERTFGLGCDNMLSAELVTATGDRVAASENENPELFWALHGGGGNFGVVTEFTFRLHDLPAFTAALFLWPPEEGPRVSRAYRDFMDTAPNEVGGGFLYFSPPPQPFVPEHLVGQLACGVAVTYAGREDAVRDLVRPIQALNPDGEMIAEMPHAQFQSMLDVPAGFRNYWSAEYLGALPDAALDQFCDRASDMVVGSPSEQVLFAQGGAVTRGAADYPIPWRRAPWAVHPLGIWADPLDDDRGRQWAKNLVADMQPWSVGAVYLNFIGAEGSERIIAGVGPENYQRLADVKARYDPDNLFHLNQNIKPA